MAISAGDFPYPDMPDAVKGTVRPGSDHVVQPVAKLAYFNSLFGRFNSEVLRYAYLRLGNWGSAEDIAQEVFLRVWRNLDGLREPDLVRPWIYRIIRNVLADKTKDPENLMTTSLEALPDVVRTSLMSRSHEASHNQETDSMSLWLRSAVTQLQPKYREVLELDLLQLTDAEIADILGINKPAVRMRRTRAKEILRQMLR